MFLKNYPKQPGIYSVFCRSDKFAGAWMVVRNRDDRVITSATDAFAAARYRNMTEENDSHA